MILNSIAYILSRPLVQISAACRPLSPISVVLIFFVRGIQKRSLSPGLTKIFPKLLVSIAFFFLIFSLRFISFLIFSLLHSVRGNKCFPCPLSDHDFVDLFLSPVNVSFHRSGVWKFNCSLLSDDDFISTMTSLITAEKEKVPLFTSLGAWWDNLKIQIRRTCIDFSSRKRKKLLSERNSLTKAYSELNWLFLPAITIRFLT